MASGSFAIGRHALEVPRPLPELSSQLLSTGVWSEKHARGGLELGLRGSAPKLSPPALCNLCCDVVPPRGVAHLVIVHAGCLTREVARLLHPSQSICVRSACPSASRAKRSLARNRFGYVLQDALLRRTRSRSGRLQQHARECHGSGGAGVTHHPEPRNASAGADVSRVRWNQTKR
jgi:hypothetical protein